MRKVKLIVHETYQGKRKSEDVFAAGGRQGTVVCLTYGSADNYVVNGIPSKITYENGTTVKQTIDDVGRITKTSIADTAEVEYNYSNGNLSEIIRTDSKTSEQMKYTFTHDSFGNMTKTKAGSKTLSTYIYADKNGLLSELEYGNGAVTKYTYDNLGRPKTTLFNNSQQLTYTYDGNGNISRIKENGGTAVILNYFNYDTLGRLISTRKQRGSDTILQTNSFYNSSNKLTKQSWRVGIGSDANTYTEEYKYNQYDGLVNGMTSGIGDTIQINRDALRRLKSVNNGKFLKSYTYRNISSERTTNQIEILKYTELAAPLTYSYTYDSMGNIKTISDPIDGSKSYTYDNQGQMKKEVIGDKIYTYTYDGVGNITSAVKDGVSHTYSYKHGSWGDLLTSYDGVSLTYDDIGNPTEYYNGTNWNFTWKNGRTLAKATSGSTTVTYTYDKTNNMRLSKKVGDTTYYYYYADDKLLRMTVSDGTVMDFFYDYNGQPYAVKYNGTKYYYILNQQGDVVRLVSSTGTSYGTYRYDAWGKVLSITGSMASTLGQANPFRYRGYHYDAETGLYYLNSRYYDPETGRFINADLKINYGVLGANVFTYCNNTPINEIDPNGTASYSNSYVVKKDKKGKVVEYNVTTIITVNKKS